MTDVVADMDPDKPTSEFGIDVGGAASFDGLRALWNATKRSNAALFEGLNPLVAVRETKASGVDLRLVVGPFASQEAVARICATLSAARRSCQPAPFEGQQFTLAAPAPVPLRRPGTPPKPAAAAPQPRSPFAINP